MNTRILLILTLLLGGCAGSYPSLQECSVEQVPEPGDENVTRFRDVYYSVARQAGFSDEQIAMQILLPTQTSGRPLEAEELAQADPVEAVTRRYQGICPVLLYENGAAQPPTIGQDVRDDLRSRPPTFIIVPGIFGEFIADAPFDEMAMNAGSAFARAHRAKLATQTDTVYDIADLDYKQLPLGDLVSLGSLDDEQGAPLVNLVLLNPRWGSLETVIAHPEAAAIYLQRLDRVFAQIPAEATADLYILGYSRGGPLGLEMLVDARRDSDLHPWAERLCGFVSLGGVLFGSELADQALNDHDSADYRLLAEFQAIADELESDEEGDGDAEKLEHTVANTGRWVEATAKIATILAEPQQTHPGLSREPLSGDIPKLSTLVSLLNSVVTDLFLADQKGEYYNDVERFKTLIHETHAGLSELSTAQRTSWWRDNTLPGDLTYFALTSTMAGMTRESGPDALFESPYFGRDTGDFSNLRKSYYSLSLLSGVELNDSQVTVPKGRFWPNLSSQLNPAQQPFEAQFLGVLGSHHWGLALTEGVEPSQGMTNEFPRTVLLEAIAAHVTGVHE